PGPLPINLDRTISCREEALALREKVKPAIELVNIARKENPSLEVVLKQSPKFHPDIGNFTLICGDAYLPDNSRVRELLIVIGNLRIGDKCRILGGAYSTGEIRVGSDCEIKFLASDSNIILGENTRVKEWVDAEGKIVILGGSFIRKVTSETIIEVIGSNCQIHEAYARLGFKTSDSKRVLRILRGGTLRGGE
ncbi:MAG: hypothetical protein DRO05_08580, partial [Thermoproteota archaeon]